MSVRLPATAESVSQARRLRLDVKTIISLDALRTLRCEWDGLIATARDFSFCLTYPYCEVAASILFTAGGTVEVIRVYDELGLCALWPVGIRRQGLIRVARALSCGAHEEYGGPLVRDETDNEVFTELVHATAKLHADVLQVRFVKLASLLFQALKTRPHSWLLPIVPNGLRDDVPGYAINLRDYSCWDEFVATRPKALFSDLRRHLKRLGTKGLAELGWCKTPGDAAVVLTWLFDNKRRWAMSRQFHTQYLMTDQVRDFFIELAHRIDLSTTPLVTFLKLDGVPVSASVNLVAPHGLEVFITTYDESLGSFSPGSLMHEFCMRWAQAHGRDFDFRPVFSTYKARWATRETRHSTQTIFLTLRGRLGEFSLLAGYRTRLMGRFRASLTRKKKAR